jgi:hypothetical protein
MWFGLLTLGTALIISLSAAVYSILGLTAIFAAAFWPIVILGGSLEVGKIVTTLWLHKYWDRAELQYKVYLCSAVAILMLLTSMGVFGFLSKAHLDQAVPSGDIAAKVQIYDDKIRTQRDNIDAARKALKQLDESVDQVMARSTSESGADKAANLRRAQQRERGQLQNDIQKSQTEIGKLQEARAPIASEMRKVEAEVGPIKYIAALIYGDNPEASVLEKSVRWVIILIVIVFDPLALTLLLAATKTFEWERPQSKRPPEDDSLTQEQWDQLNAALKDAQDEKDPELDAFFNRARDTAKKMDAGTYVPPAVFDQQTHIPVTDYYRYVDESEPVEELAQDPMIQPKKNTVLSSLDNMWENAKRLIKKDTEAEHAPLETPAVNAEPMEENLIEDENDPEKRARRLWKEDNPNSTIHYQEMLLEAGKIKKLPWQTSKYYTGDQHALVPDNIPTGLTGEIKGFGINFPSQATKGDMFLRVDRLPSALFKFNGANWIEVDKSLTDTHAYNDAYIDYLISKVGSGEYDPELLSDAERAQIEARLK